MAGAKTITTPPYDARTQLASKDGMLLPEAHKSLLQLYNAQPLVTIDTSSGTNQFSVPIAKLNQNVEITYKKISADATVPELVPLNPTDSIEFAAAGGAFAMGAAQGSKVKLKSDGVSHWYVVG